MENKTRTAYPMEPVKEKLAPVSPAKDSAEANTTSQNAQGLERPGVAQ